MSRNAPSGGEECAKPTERRPRRPAEVPLPRTAGLRPPGGDFAEALRALDRTDSDAVPVRINELNLPSPWLHLDHNTELGGQVIDGLDVEVSDRSRGASPVCSDK